MRNRSGREIGISVSFDKKNYRYHRMQTNKAVLLSGALRYVMWKTKIYTFSKETGAHTKTLNNSQEQRNEYYKPFSEKQYTIGE